MIAVDTNTLVRYLVKDDPLQARRVDALVRQLDEDQARAYVSDIVLCEIVWVLSSQYDFKRAEIALALRRLAAARQLRFDSTDNVLRAIGAYEQGKGDFADYLIREHAKTAGCISVVTFDKNLYKDGSFVAP